MPGERRALTDSMRSQRRGEPIASATSRYDGGFGGPPAGGLCGQRLGVAGETLHVETDAVSEGEARADVPVLHVVWLDRSARCPRGRMGPGRRQRRCTGGGWG